jgi:ribonuclease HI
MELSFNKQNQVAGGFIIRDTDGDHVGSGAGYIATVSEASLAEAQACLYAIQYAIGAGIQKVEIETDCLTLKTALSSKAYDDAQGGNLFREIKYLLEIHFAKFKVLHCPRTCNKVTHRLASMGAKLNDGTMLIWSDVITEDVIPLVVADLIPTSS